MAKDKLTIVIISVCVDIRQNSKHLMDATHNDDVEMQKLFMDTINNLNIILQDARNGIIKPHTKAIYKV